MEIFKPCTDLVQGFFSTRVILSEADVSGAVEGSVHFSGNEEIVDSSTHCVRSE